MIKFINKDGSVFEGATPYVHWFEGGQSMGLWYTKNLLVISDNTTAEMTSFTYGGLSENSVFKFVNKETLRNITDNGDTPTIYSYVDDDGVEHPGIACTEYEDFNWVSAEGYRICQIILLCECDEPGQFTDTFTINDGASEITVEVGADFYDKDEILSINLGNRGMELPEAVQKAFLETNIQDDGVDNILINRKFKELISNYIDIVDNRGSYKSLFNSLDWFEWGDNVKLYEIWQNNSGLFEKELESNLSKIYESLIYSYRKTTHLSLIAFLQQLAKDENGRDLLDEEKNPALKKISYQWADDELSLKISILGAFFERYFMPIHLDLKRASVEARVYSNSVKVKEGDITNQFSWMDDTGVVDIKMNHTVPLGNIDWYSVSKDTVFGKQWKAPMAPLRNTNYYLTPIGVDSLNDISDIRKYEETSQEYDYSTSELGTFYGQLTGGVGVIVPVEVTVPIAKIYWYDIDKFIEEESPYFDGINVETINVYRDIDKNPFQTPDTVTERRYWPAGILNWEEVNKAISEGIKTTDPKFPVVEIGVKFGFNLLSTKEELVTFTLVLHSLSGHTWTAEASYRAVDVRGSYLEIDRINDIYRGGYQGAPRMIRPEIGLFNGNPFAAQYDNIINESTQWSEFINPDNFEYDTLTQYILSTEYLAYCNQVIVFRNAVNNSQTELEYSDSWMNSWSSSLKNSFYVLNVGETDSEGRHAYRILINKHFGENLRSVVESNLPTSQSQRPVAIRDEFVFLPQVHDYVNIDDAPLTVDSKTGRFVMSNADYLVYQKDLLRVVPQFKSTVKSLINPKSVRWEFKNVTTGEIIEYTTPMSTLTIADNKHNKPLDYGYWDITMYYTLDESEEEHKLTKRSAFKVVETPPSPQ